MGMWVSCVDTVRKFTRYNGGVESPKSDKEGGFPRRNYGGRVTQI